MIAQKLRLSGDFDLEKIAARTPGFVGADLQALTKEAAALAVSRIFSGMQQNVEAPEWVSLPPDIFPPFSQVCMSPGPGLFII